MIDRVKFNSFRFIQCFAENIPIKSKSIDTIICTHTFEHLKNPYKTIEEFRRIAIKRIIIIVPLQREYKYTFDLHLHFFPYPDAISKITQVNGFKEIINNELIYYEDI